MFGEVPGNKDDQLVEPVEVGYLSMFSQYIPVDYFNEAPLLQFAHSSPKGSATAAVGAARRPEALFGSPYCHTVGDLGLMGDLAGFWVDKAIVSPKAEQSQYCSLLGIGELHRPGEAFPDVIPTFEEHLR